MSVEGEPFARPVMIAALAVMVIATIAGNLLFGEPTRFALLTALGVVYLAITTAGWWWAERRGPRAAAALVAVLYALTLAILWASDQQWFLLVFPPLLFAVFYTGVRWAIAATIGILAFAIVLNAGAGESFTQIYLRSTGFLPAAILTLAFAWVMVRERNARLELAELAATRERNRIARDIHDSVGHYLTVVHVQIEAARAIVARDPAGAGECLVRAQDLAREGLGELRRSVSLLRAGGDRPFGVSLAKLVDDARQAGLDAQLAVEGAPRVLPPAIEVALFRAAQEALTNVARHARATRARCTLAYRDGEVRLHVADDGAGAAATDGGHGLDGMRERLAAIGGTVEVRTAPGEGFTLDVRVPT